jgi:biopolymer transport protein ExbD
MARMAIGALLIAAMCACSSEESNEPGLLDRLGEAMTHDRREAMERRRQAELERRKMMEMKAQMEAEKRSGLTVTLPKGPSSDIDVTHVSLVIVLPASGDAVVQGRAMRDEDLDKLFRVAFTKDKTTQVIIQADQGVAHGRVVAIMEKAKAAGLTRLAIGTTSR